MNYLAISSWQPISAPNGGLVFQIRSYGTNVYASAPGSGLYQSIDNGSSWTKITNGNEQLSLTTFFEYDGTYLYAASFDRSIFRSSDQGSSWQIIHNGFNQPGKMMVNGITKLQNDLFMCTKTGLLKSTDDGNNWLPNSAFKDTNTMDIKEFNNKLYSATQFGLFSSTDRGTNWNKILDKPEVYKIFNIDNKIYACVLDTSSKNTKYMIYESQDEGGNWIPYNANVLRNSRVLGFSSNNQTFAISIEKVIDTNLVSQVYVSSNSGKNWNVIYDNPTTYIYDLQPGLCVNNDYVFIAKRYDGVLRFNIDGTNKTNVNKGIYNIALTGLSFKDALSFVGSKENGIFFSDDNLQTWAGIETSPKSNPEAYRYVWKTITEGSNLIAATSLGLYVSKDDGLSWKEMTLNDYNIVDIAIVSNKIYAVGNSTQVGHLFISDDKGKSWSIKNLPFNPLAACMYVDTLAAIVGTSSGLYKSTDDGNTWTNINSNLISDRITISVVKTKSTIVAGTYNGLFVSSDDGITWKQSDKGINSKVINNLYLLGRYIFCSSNDGAFISTNRGQNWDNISQGLNNFSVSSITSNGNNVFAVVNGDAIYKSPLYSLFGITFTGIPGNILCSGSEFKIDYIADKNINFKSDNKFIAEISDVNGDFDSNILMIGSLNETKSGSIIAKIPETIAYSDKYRIRIVSTNPSIVSSDNLSNITVLNRSVPKITGKQTVCQGETTTYSVPQTPGFQFRWLVTGGTISGSQNTNNVNILWNTPGNATITVFQENNLMCADTGTFSITVFPKPATPTITQQDSILISSSDSGNQWSLNGIVISGATNKTYKPTENGNYSVQVTNGSGCLSDNSNLFSYELSNDKMVLIIDDSFGAPGDYVNVSIRLNKNEEFRSLGVQSIAAVISFDASLLYPVDEQSSVLTSGKRFLPITIDTGYITDNIVKSIKFKAMLGDALSTSVSFEKIIINTQIKEVKNKSGKFNLTGVCIDGGPRLIASSNGAQISSLNPNPAENELNLIFQTIESGITKIYMINQLGEELKTFFDQDISPGNHELKISVNNINPGTYYVIMKTPSQKLSSWLIINR